MGAAACRYIAASLSTHLFITIKNPRHATTLELADRVAVALQGLEVRVAELVDEGQGHLGVLEHVVEGEVLDQVVGAVDALVRVAEGGLDHEGGRVAGLGGRGVIRAGVAALGLDPGDVAVLDFYTGESQTQSTRHRVTCIVNECITHLFDDLLDKVGQARVDEVGDNPNALRLAVVEGALDVTRHILL